MLFKHFFRYGEGKVSVIFVIYKVRTFDVLTNLSTVYIRVLGEQTKSSLIEPCPLATKFMIPITPSTYILPRTNYM